MMETYFANYDNKVLGQSNILYFLIQYYFICRQNLFAVARRACSVITAEPFSILFSLYFYLS